jgi:dTDP-4-dehydrorhamnose 3,5-epimerase
MNSPKLINHSKDINGLYEIQLDPFKDERGQNFEILDLEYWNYDPVEITVYGELGIKFTNGLLSASTSKYGVLRGMHGQTKGYKLIQCLAGRIQFFVVDINPESPTYKNTKEFFLEDSHPTQILLPPYSLNGHQCLSDYCTFFYIWQNGYVPQEQQLQGKWNEFELKWRIPWPILSKRDK